MALIIQNENFSDVYYLESLGMPCNPSLFHIFCIFLYEYIFKFSFFLLVCHCPILFAVHNLGSARSQKRRSNHPSHRPKFYHRRSNSGTKNPTSYESAV